MCLTREAHCKDAEVPQQSWVDGEASRCGVHASHILHVVDLLQSQLVAVIPAAAGDIKQPEGRGRENKHIHSLHST